MEQIILSPCSQCHCMTKSIRKTQELGYNYICGKCGHDKGLSDIFFFEAINREKKYNKTYKF